MRRIALRMFVFALLAAAGATQALAEKRVALVIGNSAYVHATPLKNPRNDADALAEVLGRLGFEVLKGVDLDQGRLEGIVRKFARAVRGADVALLFYAGHGLQVNGRNYLAPIDARLADEADLDFETLPLRTILKQMERETRTNIVLLDACRDNPLARNLSRSMGTRSAAIGRGLARVDSGVGTLIAFATEPGNVALDGSGGNSPFTQALLTHIETPGLDIAQLMRRVRLDVMGATANRQVPWNNSSLTGDFFFAARLIPGKAKPGPEAEPAPTSPSADDRSFELAFWRSVKDSKDAEDYRSYLERFPRGVFSKLAARRIERLEAESRSTPGRPPATGDGQGAVRERRVTVKVGRLPGKSEASGWLGVRIWTVTDAMLEGLRLDEAGRGALVAKVTDGGPADAAGLKAGDVIVRWDGKDVPKMRALPKLVAATPVGKSVELVVKRIGDGPGDFLAWLRGLAETGDAEAAHRVALAHAEAYGIPKDEYEAVRWWRKAAEKGHGGAMYRLARHYRAGTVVAKDASEAVRWYRKAAEKDNADAMSELGDVYASGEGVPKDDAEAARWYRKAAERGKAGAMVALGYRYDRGLGLAEDDAEAVRWYRKAAGLGNAMGMNNLGVMHERGRGLPKDYRESVRLYRKSAELGIALAMSNLARMYANGQGVGKDEREAFRWYRKAAEKGNAGAMSNLGLRYLKGTGVQKSPGEAVKWFYKAADKGNVVAEYMLARVHDDGLGVAKDPKAAASYMIKSLRRGYDFAVKQMTSNIAAWEPAFRRELQRLMKQEGVYTGPIDGKFGPGTRRAIEALAKK